MNIPEGGLIIVALGGNAIERADKKESYEEQWATLVKTAHQLVAMVQRFKVRMIVTHGNGPQVGSLMLQQEAAKNEVLAQPLSVCGAMSQGQIGLQLQVALQNALLEAGITTSVFALLTRTLVDANDSAFKNPTKPVGPFYNIDEANALKSKQPTWVINAVKKVMPGEDEKKAKVWRRLVPSPKPQAILEADAIKVLSPNNIVIATGGGGVPVVATSKTEYKMTDAVIDKDLASARLAITLKPNAFVILTDVPQAYLNYGTAQQKALSHLTPSEADKYLAEGHFGAGSMQPKIAACVDFTRTASLPSLITNLDQIATALVDRNVGTHFTCDPQ